MTESEILYPTHWIHAGVVTNKHIKHDHVLVYPNDKNNHCIIDEQKKAYAPVRFDPHGEGHAGLVPGEYLDRILNTYVVLHEVSDIPGRPLQVTFYRQVDGEILAKTFNK